MDHVPDLLEGTVLLWFPAVGMETLSFLRGELNTPSPCAQSLGPVGLVPGRGTSKP